MMMRKGLFVFAILISISMLAISASAQDASPESSVAAAVGRSVRLSGSLRGRGSTTSGTCTQGFSNQCPSGHACTCFTVTGAKFTSSHIGRGAAALFVTVDSTAAYGSIGNDCAPAFGELDANAKNDLANFDLIGGICTDANGNIVFNGTMGLASSTIFVSHGFAAFTSTISKSGVVVLRFKGAAQ